MPGGGDECIRNSLVCKTVSMNSKYGGAITCNVTPVFGATLCFVEGIWMGYFRGQWTPLRLRWPPIFGLWYRTWFEVTDENGSLEVALQFPEDAFLCHMKTTPDDLAQLPGATEEIVLVQGVGLSSSPLVGKQRVVCSRGAPSSPSALPLRTAAECRRGPASNRGNEFLMLQSLHFLPCTNFPLNTQKQHPRLDIP